MLAALVLIPLLILFTIFHYSEQDWRSSVLSASVTWGVLISISTEILSLWQIITFTWVLALWLLINIFLGWIYYRLVKTGRRTLSIPKIPTLDPILIVLADLPNALEGVETVFYCYCYFLEFEH